MTTITLSAWLVAHAREAAQYLRDDSIDLLDVLPTEPDRCADVELYHAPALLIAAREQSRILAEIVRSATDEGHIESARRYAGELAELLKFAATLRDDA
jgi:hypothetical protein